MLKQSNRKLNSKSDFRISTYILRNEFLTNTIVSHEEMRFQRFFGCISLDIKRVYWKRYK